eukprot:gnl/TRDRNA2_/TRDRNA2_66147_c1_seq1.p1 gnl/TRDRNA2_/TRDRNA2_66147_c1~~gnl/TRDRNA2_/TRDRNA2_66147_c1_seq1.p1  ORF type:complete len:997 (-),score=185.50 gnl/TRDRNA2_/TRDRNA2_66147_c1_seq1:16-2787(-)
MAWCEGRLPAGCPYWMTLGNTIGISGAFVFLLLTVWLAMHAAVCAQSYEVRIRTQLVRLPIPSWDEIEACRTYGSSFESLEPKQMFRVPFLFGPQEGLVATADGTATGSSREATSNPAGHGASNEASDPWGMEGRGDDIYELGTRTGAEEMAKLRHIKIVRQAAVFWSTYDAFARISMSIGVNHLMIGLSYYCLAYVMVEVEAAMPAFCGVACFTMLIEVIAKHDMMISQSYNRLLQVLLAAGPTISCIAAYQNGQHTEYSERVGEALIPIAFVSHALFLAVMTICCRVKQQENGAMLPMAFPAVLFLDVFGSEHGKSETAKQPTPASAPPTAVVGGIAGSKRQASAGAAPSRAADTLKAIPCDKYNDPRNKGLDLQEASGRNAVGYYAMDYIDIETSDADGGSMQRENTPGETIAERTAYPALQNLDYRDGLSVPKRPEDVKPANFVEDLRDEDGAACIDDPVIGNVPPRKEFYEPTSFMPSPIEKHQGISGGFAGDSADAAAMLEPAIATGHDKELAGILPWRIFAFAMTLLSIAWGFAATYSFCNAVDLWDADIPFNEEKPPQPAVSDHSFLSQSANSIELSGLRRPSAVSKDFAGALQPPTAAVPKPGFVELVQTGLSGKLPGTFSAQKLDVRWPHQHLQPAGFSCDNDGMHFMVTDGISTFAAVLNEWVEAVENAKQSKSRPTIDFKQAAPCPAIRGQAVQDTAVACPQGSVDGAGCEALVLLGHGRRVATCSLEHGTKQSGRASDLSETWLRDHHERVSSLVAGTDCTNQPDAAFGKHYAFATTSQGRMMSLRKRKGSKGPDLIPAEVVLDGGNEYGVHDEMAINGAVRVFTDRYVGLLQDQRQSIKVIDSQDGGRAVGSLMLPVSKAIGGFCVGGNHIYMIGKGASPELWRFPVPNALRQPAQFVHNGVPQEQAQM